MTAFSVEETASAAPESASEGVRCVRHVPVVDARVRSARPYDVVSRIEVTCAPLLPGECDETLRARACAAGADAIVLDEPQLALMRVSSTSAPRKTLSGSLVRWQR